MSAPTPPHPTGGSPAYGRHVCTVFFFFLFVFRSQIPFVNLNHELLLGTKVQSDFWFAKGWVGKTQKVSSGAEHKLCSLHPTSDTLEAGPWT